MSMLSHLHQLFNTDTCHTYIHTLRWKDRPLQCPRCHSHDVDPWGKYHYRPGCKRYWCNGCKRTFNDLTNTLLHQSQRSLPHWILTTFLLCLACSSQRIAREVEQLPLSPRRNELPVKRIDLSRLMICEYATCALIELMQIGKTPSSADPVLHHAPEAFHRIEMVSAMRRQEMQPKLLVPVGQRRCELMRPVDATAVGNHDHLFARVAKDGHHLMDVLAKPLRLKMGHDLVEDFRGAIRDCPNHTEQHAAGDPAPGAILHPCLAFEGFRAFDLALAQRARGEARALRFAPPACPGQGKAPQDR